MKLPEFGVKQPVTTAMVFIAIVILGLVSLTRLGLDLMPDIEIPTIGVITTYEGAGAQEVETRVTEVIEDRVSTVSELDKLESTSEEGLSVVTLKFDWGINLDEATNEVRDKLDLAKKDLPDIPDEIDEPIIFKFNLAMFPILVLGVTAEESYPGLYDLIDDEICDPLKRVPGVATAVIRGGLERQILVEVDRQRLESYDFSVQQLVGILRAENLNIPGGHLKTGRMDYLVRTPEELEVPEISDIVVAAPNGNPIYLRDVANVKDAFKEVTHKVHVDKKLGLAVMVQKQSGTNTVQVVRRALKELKVLQRNLPPDVKLKVVTDASDFIKRSIGNLVTTILWGGFFVMLVILFFLRDVRTSLIIATSIPTSLVITFALMYLAGYTLNMMSLSSLAIAMGMVVDCAIVILDNIHRHRELGERPSEGAIFGSSEMAKAVIASTLTTIVIFIPIVFVGGITGILFKEMAFVICLALIVSLLTALTLIPMLSSKFLPLEAQGEKRGILKRFYTRSESWFTRIDERYRLLLGWALSHRRRIIGGGVAILILSFFLVRFVGNEFMPDTDEGRFTVNIELPVGTRYEETGKVTQVVESIVTERVPELETSFSKWGYGGGGIATLLGGEEGSHIGMCSAKLIPKERRRRSSKEVAQSLRSFVSSFPGAEVRFSSEDPLAGLLYGGGKALSVEVRGYDLEAARGLSRQVARVSKGIRGVTDVEISRKEGKPEIQIVVDRDKASRLGLNVSSIGGTVQTLFKGEVATKYREGGDEYDIFVRLREEDRRQMTDLQNVFITSPSGKQIRLSNIACINYDVGPIKIERKDQERIIKVTGDIYGRDLGSVVKEAKEKFSKLSIPEGFSLSFGGEREEQEKSFRLLFFALILGIILVYMVMASQFESLRDPFIILFSIPFAMIGVIWALLLTRNTFSMNAFIGLIMLVGIVVNNAIVLISYINILRARGLSVKEAIMTGGRTRLRPVLMTTITTVFGLLPLVLSRGEGSEFWVPFGVTIIGGLLVSTLITLIFVPILYSVFEERVKGRAGR